MSGGSERARWDERHRASPPDVPRPPSGVEESSMAIPDAGRMLDVACGTGAAAVWAATRGLDVVALDRSPVAVESVLALALAHDVEDRVDVRVHDLDEGLPDELGSFDLVVCQRYRDPALWPALVSHVRPGGSLAVSVLSTVGGTGSSRFRAGPGELQAELRALGVRLVHASEGGGLATVVGVRPERTVVARVPAMDDQLRSVLDELKATIVRSEADGVIDDAEREELRSLTEKLDALLAEEDEDDGLVDHLEEYAIRFEGDHPTVAAAIRSAVHTLTGYGM